MFTIDWKLFSQEMNATTPDADLWAESRRYSEAHVALMLARREGGGPAFEALYVALGRRLHERKEEISRDLANEAADELGLGDLVDRAVADPGLAQEMVTEYEAARARSVFGVPTLSLDDSKALFGPILPLAPRDDDALEWWTHISWLLKRPDFFELKRWPRDLRPRDLGPIQAFLERDAP